MSLTSTISNNLNLYNGCPQVTLDQQTKWGNNIHRIVEDIFENDLQQVPSYVDECSLYWVSAARATEIKIKANIKATSIEETVKWNTGQYGIWTIRTDIVGTYHGTPCIMDIKATKNLNKQAVQAQLSAYAYAIMARDNVSAPQLLCLHLPMDDLGELIKIDLMDYSELLDFLKNNTVEGVECWEGSNWNPASDHKIW